MGAPVEVVRRAPALVVGGGLLGGHVAVALARRGHPTTVVSRSFNPWLRARAGEHAISLVELLVAPSSRLTDLIESADVVFFLAGASTPLHADRNTAASALDSVLTALTVLDLMRQTATRRIVLASSGGTVYGEPSTLPTPEEHPLAPISMHGINSAVVERYADFYARQHGFEVTVLRYSNVYGPGQTGRRGQGVIAAWCRALAQDQPITVFGELSVRRDFVFTDDAAAATVAAGVAPGVTGTFNVGTTDPVTLGDVLDRVIEASGRTPTVHRKPARGLDVTVTSLDCSRLAEQAAWAPSTALDDGIGESWRWLSDHLTGPAAEHAVSRATRIGLRSGPD